MKAIPYFACLVFWAVVIFLISGCSVFMEPVPESVYNWQKTHEARPSTEHIIPQQAVQAYCSQTGRFVMACSYWDHEQCWIFASSKGLMDMMSAHETKHCQGWSHQVI